MASVVQAHEPRYPRQPGTGYPLDDNRGTWGVWLTILTEGMLFVCLFGSYFYLENNKDRWHIDEPPKMHLAVIMLAVLLTSSFVLHCGEKQLKLERYTAARGALAVTILLGIGFLGLSAAEYLEAWKELTPYSDSFGSLHYTIVSFHAAHVIVGLLILIYTLAIPRYSPALRSPYRPYHVASLYWHFVDAIWVVVFTVVYLLTLY